MIRTIAIIGFFFATLSCVTAAAQVTLYVAPNGQDTYNGTLSRPFRTPERALAQATLYSGKQVTIFLRKGKYYLAHPLSINNRLKTRSLTLAAFHGENVVISAGRLLHLNWEPYQQGIYRAKVPDGVSFERLYVNGTPQVLARYPNYDSTAKVFNGTAADAISPQRVKQWKNPVGGYVHALHAGEWGGFHYRITGVDEAGKLQLEGGWQNNRPAAMHKQYRFVENIFEELDAPDEWFLDRKTATLYYFPPKGLDLHTATIEVSQFRNSIELTGTSSNPLKNIVISDITFLHNERSFMETKEPLLRSDWTIYRGGTLLLENTENCKITHCRFFDNGGNAILLSGYNKQDTISNNHIANTGASAIAFVGKPDAIRSPLFRYEGTIPYDKMDEIPGPRSNDYPQECIAVNNLIHDIGRIEKQATGVEIEMASRITVKNNSIYNTPRAGINIGDGCFGGHLIEYNDVFNTVLETGDHGAFNSWGRDRYWNANRTYMDSLVALHPELILLDAQQTTTLRNNRFRCDHGWDIDLDDGSSNYHIYNNVCLNGGLKLREGFYRTVENNIMVNNTFHPHVWFQNSGDVFRRNIVMAGYAPIGMKYWGKEIDSNFFNSKNDLEKAQARQTDRHSLFGDPHFADPAAGNYNVALQSPALQTGFKNFPMDSFGVQDPALKKLAAKPQIPLLIGNAISGGNAAPVHLLGAVLKSVQGPGDRSAYGLPDERGVIIVTLSSNSPLKTAGLQENDVIRKMDGAAILNTDDLEKRCQTSRWKGTVKMEAIRNQQPVEVKLALK
ncbi:MAG: PDZ domain-containing protein [Niabella sp.]|nr:PDZ domain-containing protein [Niabella sp.]